MKEGRVHLRLDDRLLTKAKAYAKRRHTTLSELIRQHLVELLEEEERAKTFDAPQI